MLSLISSRIPSAVRASELVRSLNFSQMRFKFKGVKTKKRPPPSKKYLEDIQKWRTAWGEDKRLVLADSIRGYIDFSVTKRKAPWDNRHFPFDRQQGDGVHLIVEHFMKDSLEKVYYHQRPVKRLFCNIGLLGPSASGARWKNSSAATLNNEAQYYESHWKRNPNMKNTGYND